MKSSHRIFQAAVVLVAGLSLSAVDCRADLDEGGFETYAAEELLNQSGWQSQGTDESGRYVSEGGRSEVRPETGRGNCLVWLSGFPAAKQTRLVKSFPPVSGGKAEVRFDFLPGHTTLPGRLIFDSGNGKDSLSLRFVKGTLQILPSGSAALVDTGLAFRADEWNRLEVRFDFAGHQAIVSLDGEKSSTVPLPEGLTQLSRVILFGGGIDFESKLDNLTVRSATP